MRRRLFNFTTRVSLILCAGAIVLWTLSYWRGFKLALVLSNSDEYQIAFVKGRVGVAGYWLLPFLNNPIPDAPKLETSSWTPSLDDSSYFAHLNGWAGFAFARLDNPSGVGHTSKEIWCPLWAIALLSAILPVAHRRRQRQAERSRSDGRCVSCGYDLTGNTSGACPECGKAIEEKAGPDA